MKGFCLMLILFAVGYVVPAHVRSKRHLSQFADMIRQATGVNSATTNYNDYGCWCGYGGSGDPLDETDKVHDDCYDSVTANACSEEWNPVHIEYYIYSITGSTAANTVITCGPGNSECEQDVCTCDQVAAYCFRANRNDDEYHVDFQDYDKDQC